MPYVNKPRPYKKEYEQYQGKPEQIKNRAKRNAARAELMKQGKVHKGDGKDVDHAKPLSKGEQVLGVISKLNPLARTDHLAGTQTTPSNGMRAKNSILTDYNWPGKHKPFAHQKQTSEFLTLNRKAFCLTSKVQARPQASFGQQIT